MEEYNREKDRVTIEKTFEELLKFIQGLNEKEGRAMREGLDEETRAVTRGVSCNAQLSLAASIISYRVHPWR